MTRSILCKYAVCSFRRGHLLRTPFSTAAVLSRGGAPAWGSHLAPFSWWSWRLCGTFHLAESTPASHTETASTNRWAIWPPRWPARHSYNLTGFLPFWKCSCPAFCKASFGAGGYCCNPEEPELSNSASNCGIVFSQRSDPPSVSWNNIRQRREYTKGENCGGIPHTKMNSFKYPETSAPKCCYSSVPFDLASVP